MTYNIKNGGRNGRTSGRLDHIASVINSVEPDVLGLQELGDLPAAGRMPELAEAVRMRAFPARSWFGQPVAILVRPPGRVAGVAPVRRPFHHAAQRVVVGTTGGPLRVLCTHLFPYSGARRLVEARWAAAACGRGPNQLTLLMGDLNTLDPWTDHRDRIRRLPPEYRSRHLRRASSTVDSRAVSALDRAGLVDLFRRAGEGEPETAPTRHGGGAEFSGMRLDYLFGTPALAARTRRCTVLRGGVADVASDHYPVIGDIDLAFG
ncbi:MAG TPA: endonuclease/exonuclease/phosphatase family protein [Micromonosporaceae bacterium]